MKSARTQSCWRVMAQGVSIVFAGCMPLTLSGCGGPLCQLDPSTGMFSVNRDAPLSFLLCPFPAPETAYVTFDLPETITVGGSLNLAEFTDVSPNAPANAWVLYYPNVVPPDVVIEIDEMTDTLEVIAGAGETIEIAVEVFGTSRLLAEDSDTILLVAAP